MMFFLTISLTSSLDNCKSAETVIPPAYEIGIEHQTNI